VAAQFHASTNGLAAADAAFSAIDAPASQPKVLEAGPSPVPVPSIEHPVLPDLRAELPSLTRLDSRSRVSAIDLSDVSVFAPERGVAAPAELSARIELAGDPEAASAPGQIVALTGPTGAGKSTTAQLMLGLLEPDAGDVILETSDGDRLRPADYGLEQWWRQVVWVPQRPYRDPATANLSVGQRHRVALAAALNAPPDRQLLLLDEPTAHLDGVTEESVLETLRSWRDSGRTAIVIAHRPAVIAAADQVIAVHAAQERR